MTRYVETTLVEKSLGSDGIGHNAMLEQDAVHIGGEADLDANVLDVQCRELFVKGLLDNGAVVSVMPVST